MARKPLRSQLNQIRGWVRQGRTDAWIAHQLEVSASELSEFRRRHELSADSEDSAEVDLRDEIEAEIEAAALEEAEAAEAAADELDEDEDAEEDEDEETNETFDELDSEAADGRDEPDDQPPPRGRRGRRGGRGRRRGGAADGSLQATFDHGESDGYGLWLDPAVRDNPVYTEHWAGKRRIEVSIEPDQIVIRRSD